MTGTVLLLLAAPFVACLIVLALHAYVGIHVIRREVIFIDLALAQVAALGAAVAILAGFEPSDPQAYAFSLGFALAAALLFAFTRLRGSCVPQEAIIGIVYAVSAGMAFLVLNYSPHGMEELKKLLVGTVLFVKWSDVAKLGILYAALGLAHLALSKRFLLISYHPDEAEKQRVSMPLWDFIFYALFAIMVTQSVRIAGVLLVFSYLIVPGVAVMLFVEEFRRVLVWSWVFALAATVLGLLFSGQLNWPTGESLVSTLGGLLAVLGLLRLAIPRRASRASAAPSASRRAAAQVDPP
jgi:zinc/manganese transport system permease protein